jgi:chemotaxis family two-component system response regulator Rcp1
MEPTFTSPVRILVIEDNAADVELLRMALEDAQLPADISVLQDGGAALAVFHEAPNLSPAPDLIVLDLNLPKYDGLELLEAARSSARFGSTPIAILSSSSSPREQTRIGAFGRVMYITKPPELDAYLAIGVKLRDFLLETWRCAASGK